MEKATNHAEVGRGDLGIASADAGKIPRSRIVVFGGDRRTGDGEQYNEKHLQEENEQAGRE